MKKMLTILLWVIPLFSVSSCSSNGSDELTTPPLKMQLSLKTVLKVD